MDVRFNPSDKAELGNTTTADTLRALATAVDARDVARVRRPPPLPLHAAVHAWNSCPSSYGALAKEQ
jgi:hypothetical protein